jgi:hypothetical protein
MSGDPLAAVRRLRRVTSPPRAPVGESCELCREPVGPDHNHLVDLQGRTLMCSCRLCWLLFTRDGAGGGHYTAVPERYVAFPDLRLSRAEWDALQIPVSVAFFFLNSSIDRVAAFYPGPAGATESLLPLDTWDELALGHPELATMVPDVEAFLVRAERGSPDAECFLVPIDACYELVGRLRTLWRGFDGGREAHDALEQFFADVRARAS